MQPCGLEVPWGCGARYMDVAPRCKEAANFAQLVKIYSPAISGPGHSPPHCKGARKRAREGNPDPAHMSTSFVERSNLSIRMQNRRFTRLTNGFSKKLANHSYMLAITMVFYNFCRPHKSLKGQTPAMVAGLTDYVWSASDLLALDMWHVATAA